ncbi:Transposase IS66 family protein [Stieleria neptunia]|uniref:Transposase IS66 family protein n=1 Tax=Stieleria neptunia TaxID=2527979 RepID=A0A518HII0_9BACT|nr:IS66 family transposase [Stieleria neptunia]QDV40657.1 Transposase IS66 family protein [Stieleria neptunia]QDV42503.1 Transposase IS66 family protein [Stieleria neptunia]QDV43575.1 Transposase IS66 family protein [Stieleria neptunia]QDV43807.1 Transposase IS66 family protein [Stieleria neptunia]QDV45820.1 Transposase IS66 family protein [Stieleria neptunia]
MDKLKQLQREIEALRAKNSTLESVNESLAATNASLTNKVDSLAVNNQSLATTNESLVQDAKSLAAAKEDLESKNEDLRKQLSKKQDELDALIRRIFGRQSERFEDDDQLKFEFASQAEIDDAREGIKQAIEENDRAGKRNKPPKRRKREERFPDSLPRKEVIVDLSDEEKEGLVRIGEDVVESAHFTRGAAYIIRKIFPKYVHPEDPRAGILQAPRPAALIQGDRYDTSFAASVIANRLGYHLPIYRQEDMFAECGLYLSRSTLLNLQEAAERVLRPFVQWLADLVRTDSCIGSDDTSIRLLLPQDIPEAREDDPKGRRAAEVFAAAKSKGLKSITAKMWAYRGVHIPINVFDFTVSRHRDGPDQFLVDSEYTGTLLGDCYGANTGIYIRSNGLIVHAACAAHARRKVEAALDNHAEHAKHLLGLFRLIYDVEDEARELSPAERLTLRQKQSAPLWGQMREYLQMKMMDVLSSDKISDARSYILNQWQGLTAHLEDGEIPIDNNSCEQLMKQVALGRKNWLFLGSLASGYRTATLMTVVSSAIRNDLDVAAYLEDVLDQLLAGSRDYAALRPDAWGTAHPESIRAHRQKEREADNIRRERDRLRRRLARLDQ